ncbi:hypothetical protein ACFQY4_26730 [Catellatospora bangladeshensis]|uniref:hypothetical protein n=1 Tax=Catellatospora bangladeshensis TaxID=310355 RepID=UPI003608C938
MFLGRIGRAVRVFLAQTLRPKTLAVLAGLSLLSLALLHAARGYRSTPRTSR